MPISEPAADYVAGDIVVVPFPFSDRLAEKRRPALVVSGPALARYGVHWVVMVTSSRSDRLSCDVEIQDLSQSGLQKPSMVRTAKLACLEPDRILRRAGRADEAVMTAVRCHLASFLKTK
jgi:mRNA interferase MazF